MAEKFQPISLPTADQIRRAIELYLARAYDGPPPQVVQQLSPPESFDPVLYLMGEAVERTPNTTKLQEVRSFALRLGNALYRNMKLRLSRPPNEPVYVFSVDSHDAFLKAPPGSPDRAVLDELKRHNAEVAASVAAAWDAAKLPTERSLLRKNIRQVRRKNIGKAKSNPPEGSQR